MPGLAINDAGTWRSPISIFVNDSGTWREIKKIYVNDAGTWRVTYQSIPVLISLTSLTRNDGSNSASYELNPDGNIYANPDGIRAVHGTWMVFPVTASDYESRATIVSGTASTGTIGAWENLGSARTWTRTSLLGAFSTVVLTLEIRRVSDGVVLDTKNVTITCDRR